MRARNNFDLLRLVLATAVMLYHVAVLSAADELAFLGRWFDATWAVWGFFVISGYLITMSHERSSTLGRFAIKRVRRLVPGYVAVVMAAAVGGAWLTTLAPGAYFASPQWWRYVAANLTFANFLQPALPGVFEANPFGPAVNGALWSIRTELACYAAVPVVCLLARRVGRGAACAAAMAACALGSAALLAWHQRTGSAMAALVQHAVTQCGLCFAVGMAAYFAQQRLRGRWFTLAGLACTVLIAGGLRGGPWLELALRPLVLGLAVMWLALGVRYLGNWGRFGDLSYGLYIWHFPVIQTLLWAGAFARSPWGGLGLSVGITAALAWLSWHGVEKRFLRRDSHYVRAAAGVDEAPATDARPTGDA